MSLLRPPLLRAGSLDANRVPSRMGDRLVQHQVVDLGVVAVPAPTPAPAPAPAPAAVAPITTESTCAADRASALQAARQLAQQHHITAAELADHDAARAAAIAEARRLIQQHGISRQQLFGR